jgi:hypothetical protein
MSDTEPEPVAKTKRKINEVQMANLRKGMEMMKAKRAAREDYETKVSKGEDAVPPAPTPKKVKAPKVVTAPAPPPEVVVVERKKREVKPNPMVAEMAALRAEMSALKAPAVVKEVVVEKPVEKVVHKERVVTGSEMLNLLFNLK